MVNVIDQLDTGIDDTKDLLQMVIEDDDAEALESVDSEISDLLVQLERLEFRRMFSGEMDPNNAFLDIQSGSGGTEAQDWAKML